MAIKISKYAENSLDSRTLFETRKRYKQDVLKTEEHYSIDLWTEKAFYGRVNSKNEPVYLSETNLKQIETDETIFAVDFVVEAFNDFNEYMKKSLIMQKISEDSPFAKIRPKKAFESVVKLHHDYMNDIYKAFVFTYLKKFDIEKRVKNFQDFLSVFLTYFEDRLKNVTPVTRSGFILSQHSNPNISGLIIEIDKQSYSSDGPKENKYVNSPDFIYYENAAKKFGFFVDKNAPWRLIANVSSLQMQKYMEKYGIKPKVGTASELFDIYYYNSQDKDLEILKEYLIQFYTSFVATFPVFLKAEVKDCGGVFLKKAFERQKITKEVADNLFNQEFWIKFYFKIRLFESNKWIGEKSFFFKARKAISLQKYVDTRTTMRYINKESRLM